MRSRTWSALLRMRQAAESCALRFGPSSYRSWLRRHERERPAGAASGVTISILMAGAGSPRLDEAVASVQAQSHLRWELCIYGSGGWCAADDAHIRKVDCGGDAAATLNRAGEVATGEYIAVLDPNDVLAPHALAWIVQAIDDSHPDVLYTDEDVAGRRPIFKPDWSPDLLTSANYIGGLFVVSRAAMDRAGWFRAGCDGAEVYDLALRVAESGAPIRHVPRVLYHRRHEPDTGAERRALEDAFRRRGVCTRVEDGSPWMVHRIPSGTALASIIVCSRRPELLRACIGAIDARTSYSKREIVAVQHGFTAPLGDKRLKWDGPFDFAAMANLAARDASGDVLVFLNDDVTPVESGWLDALVAQVERPEVGIAGALLEYPNGTIQHAGVVVGIANVAAHPLRGLTESLLWPWARLTRNVSAVTGACMAIRKSIFEELGGFDTAFPVNYNDVDLCLRAREVGYEVILESAARLVHDEARTRDGTTSETERRKFFERWRGIIERGDPYYSPNLSRSREAPKLT